MAAEDSRVDQARSRFPRGLVQPENGFRFAVDSLLLASFAATRRFELALELGAGCGAAGLGLLLLRGKGGLRGVDRDAEMVAAARANAVLLGLEHCAAFSKQDLCRRDEAWRHFAPPGSFDLVLANPPYRDQASGRMNPEPTRAGARFELHAGLEDFAAAARSGCSTRARFCLVYLAERLQQAVAVLDAAGFALKRLLPVHSRAGEPARLVLLEARKQAGQGVALEPPLVLYQGAGQATGVTEQALAFCPFLACNAGGRQPEAAQDSEP